MNERIDYKLFNTGKLDFEQMKKIMARLNRIDDALLLDEVITPHLKQYEYLCEQKNIDEGLNMVNWFESNFVEVFKKHLLNEKNRFGNQVERCNLYYQAKLNTTTVKIAWAAFGASILSIALAIVAILMKA